CDAYSWRTGTAAARLCARGLGRGGAGGGRARGELRAGRRVCRAGSTIRTNRHDLVAVDRLLELAQPPDRDRLGRLLGGYKAAGRPPVHVRTVPASAPR